jgi:O-antigen ligase
MTNRGRVYDIAILTLIIWVLLFTPFSFGGVSQTKALLARTFLAPMLFYSNYFARAAIALAVMLWLLKLIATRDMTFVRTPLDIPIALFVVYTFFWFVLSKAKYLTGGELANVVSYVALYYLIVNNVKTKMRMNLLASVFIFSGFLIATIGLVQSSGYLLPSSQMKLDYALNLVRPKQYWGRVGGTFVCPNHFAGYLEMVIPFALAYVLFSKIPPGRKILIAFCGLVMTMGLLLSISRGGWVAFAVSAAFLFAFATREKKVRKMTWVIPMIVLLIGGAVVFTTSSFVQERFKASFGKEDSSYLKRLHVWLDTMSLARDHLLVGTGPGTFELAYREYRRPSVLLAIRFAHNDYIHTLADFGAIGLVIVLSGIVAFGKKMWDAAERVKRRADKTLAYGVLAAFIAILVHSLVDFNMRIPSNAMTMAAIIGLGMCLRYYRLSEDDEWIAISNSTPGFFSGALQAGLALVVVALTAGTLYLNSRAYASALVLHHASEKDPSREFRDQKPEEKDFEAADRLYRKAARLFPSNPKPWANLAQMHLSKADQTLSEGQKNRFRFLLMGGREARKDYENAASAVKKALRRNDLDSSHRLMLARAYAGIVRVNREYKQGSPKQYSPAIDIQFTARAIDEFQKAIQMDPNNHDHHGHLAAFYFGAGRYDQAEREVLQALEILRDDTTFWTERQDLQKLLKKIRQKQQETSEAKTAFPIYGR